MGHLFFDGVDVVSSVGTVGDDNESDVIKRKLLSTQKQFLLFQF